MLLSGGRIIAALLNMVIQVLTVRALTQSGFAAFAYGIAIAGIGEVLGLFGMHRAVTVLLPRHEQARDARAAMGTLVLVVITVVTIGLGFVLVVVGFRGPIAGSLASDDTALVVLVILALLGPIMSAEVVLDSLYATFGRPLAIFLRQYLLVPGLRLLAVLVVVVGPGDPVVLAWGYVLGGVVGLVVAVQGFRRLLRQHALYRDAPVRLRGLPIRATGIVAVPLFANTLTELALDTMDALMLAQLSSPDQLAMLRAIAPIARANEFIVTGFAVLFAPMAARMIAADRGAALSHLYWRTALWRGVLAFPVLMLTTILARPITVLLFGDEYGPAAPMLMVIGAGVYVGALLGPNDEVLEASRRFRPLIIANVCTIVLLVVLNLFLIPRFGGFGAAVATGLSMVFQSLVSQTIVQLRTPITRPDRALLLPYVTLLTAMGIAGISMLIDPGLLVDIAVAGGLSVVVFLVARRELDVAGTFPALAAIPVLGRVLGGRRER